MTVGCVVCSMSPSLDGVVVCHVRTEIIKVLDKVVGGGSVYEIRCEALRENVRISNCIISSF